jgi:hypothetical protein
MVCGGLCSLIDYPLIVLHLHQLLLLLAMLVRGGCPLQLISTTFLIWGVANDEIVNLGKNLDVTTVIHHYNVVIIIAR